jgi:RNA polymerase II subunit A C-terminal domain phosphatase SSU72
MTSNDSGVKFAVICASNQNRSMEAHHVLSKNGLNVCSFGTNTQVKIPGPSPDRPNIYPFSCTYEEIYQDLKNKDVTLYTQNGLLQMLDRNRKTKSKPERFHETSKMFDVIITCEERCFDIVVEELMSKSLGVQNKPVFVVNVDIMDNHEDAALGARSILMLAEMLEACKDSLEEEFETIIENFKSKTILPVLHCVCYY